MVQKFDKPILTPSQTAGPYVHIGLAPEACGIEDVPFETLGREIAGLDTDATVVKQLMGRSDADSARAIQLATDAAATEAVDAAEDLALAIVATEQLAAMGQVPFSGAAIERTKRRMDVYRKCMQLWHHQDETPIAYEPGGVGGKWRGVGAKAGSVGGKTGGGATGWP